MQVERPRRRGVAPRVAIAWLAMCMLTACAPVRYSAVVLDRDRMPAAQAAARLDTPEYAAALQRLGAVSTWPPAAWTPAQLGVLAVLRSRDVTAARAAVAAAVAGRAVAARRANPTFALNLEHHSDTQGGTAPHWSVGPSLDFSLAPVSRRRIAVALADTAVVAARADVLDTAWAARRGAVEAALDLAQQRRQAELAAASERAREDVIAAARAEVAAGVADSFEWQTLQIEANSARLDRLELVSTAAGARAALAAALNLPLAAVQDLRVEAGGSTAEPGYDELQRRMLMQHPRVLRALATYDKSEHDLALAVAAQFPEVHLTPGYFFDQGDNVWSLLGGVVVPVFATQAAPIRAASVARDGARERFYAEQAAVIADLQAAWGQWQSAQAAADGARAIAADTVTIHTELVAKAASGVAGRLLVARAALQARQVAARAAAAELRAERARLALEQAARVPMDDRALEQCLGELYAEEPASVAPALP